MDFPHDPGPPDQFGEAPPTNAFNGPNTTPAITNPLTTPVSVDEKNWAIGAHLSGLVLGFLGPLIVYLVKKDDSAYVADHAKEALNFCITVMIAVMGLIVLSLPLVTMILTIPLLFVVVMGSLVFFVMAAIKVSNNEPFSYPFTLRLIK